MTRKPRAEAVDPSTCRVLVVSPSSVFGESLARLIEADGGVAAVAAAPRDLAEVVSPDTTVLLVDVECPAPELSSAVAAVRQAAPAVRVLLLVRSTVAAGSRMADDLGAAGCVSRSVGARELLEAVRAAHCNERIRADRAPRLARSDDEVLLDQLTQREREVLALLAGGANNDGIATALGITPNTVRTHVQNILTKIGARNRHAAAAFAHRLKVVEAPRARARRVDVPGE